MPLICIYCNHVNTVTDRPHEGEIHYCDNPRGCKANAWATYWRRYGWVWKRERVRKGRMRR